MTDWALQQLTYGSNDGRFHSHSYYDVPVMDRGGANVLVHRMAFAGRHPQPDDTVAVGVVDAESPGSWTALGESRAWSWQQGPMAQWVAGGPKCVFNDRGDDGFVARIVDTQSGKHNSLARPCYAVDHEGRFYYSLNMARLVDMQPGYGYAGGSDPIAGRRSSDDDGVWRVSIDDGAARLVLSLDAARRFLMERSGVAKRVRHRLARYSYVFNHIKLSPDGSRFTVKLRWRRPGGRWADRMGASLTANIDGSDLRLLADATSHVVWLNSTTLYCWRKGELVLFSDRAPRGARLRAIAPSLIDQNVHIRHLPPRSADELSELIFDTPYKERVKLICYNDLTGAHGIIAAFANHVPALGPFRCDLHPCPSDDGRKIIVTSLADGGRQVYLLARR